MEISNSFLSIFDLKKHERTHTEENPYNCSHCDKEFLLKTDLEEHEIALHHDEIDNDVRSRNNEIILSCLSCDKSFGAFNDLRRHKKCHEEKFSCKECDTKFKNFRALNKHKHCPVNSGQEYKIQDENLNEHELFSCPKCDKKFPRIQNLKDHERSHKGEKQDKTNDCACLKNGENEKPFSCSNCDKSKNLDSKIKVMSWNICRGTVTHMAEIEETIRRENADLIFLLETDSSKENLESIKIQDFKAVVGSPGKFDGKVRLMAFIKSNIPFKFREDLSSPDCSVMWLEIERKNKKNVLVAGIYREWGSEDRSHPKNRSKVQQIERLEIITKSLDIASSEKKEIVMAGDFNLDMKKWDNEDYG